MQIKAERLQLRGLDRARYFMPTAICAYLFALCCVLIITSAFLANPQNAIAVAAAGVFGLVLSGGLGWAFWHAQRRDLQYTRVAAADAAAGYAAVRGAMLAAGWRIMRDEPGYRLDAQASALLLNEGERGVGRQHLRPAGRLFAGGSAPLHGTPRAGAEGARGPPASPRVAGACGCRGRVAASAAGRE
jgi:hypothetical protein